MTDTLTRPATLLVQTFRLGDATETNKEIAWAIDTDGIINDRTARTIAYWNHDCNRHNRGLTALATGTRADVEVLYDEIQQIADVNQQTALMHWLDAQTAMLAG